MHQSSIAQGRGGGLSAIPGDEVSVSILGLFHARELVVSVPVGHALVLRAGEQNIVLEDSQLSFATVRIDGSDLIVSSANQEFRAANVTVAGRANQSEDFTLEIPTKIKRRYHGKLVIRAAGGTLLSVVTLDLETAVASVVAAESLPDTPVEALKAYAIAARSFFVAGGGRHRSFDFCDTTHCQFLRTPPPESSPVVQAVAGTRGMVLAYKSRPFAAMYTRSCSGRTHTPVQERLTAGAYPYYSVECDRCRQHPVRWTSNLNAEDAASLRPSNEGSRLAVAQRLGWSAVPSNDFSVTKSGNRLLLIRVGNGHGIGLCQAGAKAMADSGARFREILEHYYPNSDLIKYSQLDHLD